MPIDERYIINKYLKPLSKGAKGAFNLEDDTAVFENNINITSSDSFVENIHFFNFLPAKYIALRALGASFSDLASKGAKPFYYSLCVSLPKLKNTEQWFKSFVEGLQEFQNEHGVHLIGGDTTKSKDSIVISVNVFGFLEKEKVLNICKRDNAKVSNDVYVTNALGGAYLDFLSLKKHKKINHLDEKGSYLKPAPRFEFAELIKTFATASCDVSDGVLLDLERICESSNVSARIEFESIPVKKTGKNKELNFKTNTKPLLYFIIVFVKPFFKLVSMFAKSFKLKKHANINFLKKEVKRKVKQLAFGDDYELIFCAKKEDFEKIQMLTKDKNLQITKIGSIVNKDKNFIILVDEKGKEIFTKGVKGFIHYF